MTKENINEICRSFAMGMTVEKIAEVEEISVDEINKIKQENESTIKEYSDYYARRGQ